MEKTTDKNVSCLKKDLQLGHRKKTIDLAKTKNILIQDKKLNSSRRQTSSPERVAYNSKNIFLKRCSSHLRMKSL